MKVDNNKIIYKCGECSHCIGSYNGEDRIWLCTPIKPKYGAEQVNYSQAPSVNCPLPDFKEYYSFDEWNKLGFVVIKGEKSKLKKGRVCLFHNSQVKKKVVSGCLDEDIYDPYEGMGLENDYEMFGESR